MQPIDMNSPEFQAELDNLSSTVKESNEAVTL